MTDSSKAVTERLASARRDLARLGFSGPSVYFAELIPAAEMAWADGVVQAHERALLEAYAEELVAHLNTQAGFPLFKLGQALACVEKLLQQRMKPHERQSALAALEVRAGTSSHGLQMKRRMIEWAEAVAAVAGRPVWDSRELFWLQALYRTLGTRH